MSTEKTKGSSPRYYIEHVILGVSTGLIHNSLCCSAIAHNLATTVRPETRPKSAAMRSQSSFLAHYILYTLNLISSSVAPKVTRSTSVVRELSPHGSLTWERTREGQIVDSSPAQPDLADQAGYSNITIGNALSSLQNVSGNSSRP
jgi:hypothetical protein